MALIRQLQDLAGVGPAALGDFHLLGIQTIEQLAAREPDQLFAELCERTGVEQDVCVLDVLRCAVAQARDPELPAEQHEWWWWSRQRKAGLLG
jgi:Pathogenicity locus